MTTPSCPPTVSQFRLIYGYQAAKLTILVAPVGSTIQLLAGTPQISSTSAEPQFHHSSLSRWDALSSTWRALPNDFCARKTGRALEREDNAVDGHTERTATLSACSQRVIDLFTELGVDDDKMNVKLVHPPDDGLWHDKKKKVRRYKKWQSMANLNAMMRQTGMMQNASLTPTTDQKVLDTHQIRASPPPRCTTWQWSDRSSPLVCSRRSNET
eukprot:gene39956-49387_t